MNYEQYLRGAVGLAQAPSQEDEEVSLTSPKLSEVPSNDVYYDENTLFSAVNSDWNSYLGDNATTGIMELLAKLNKKVQSGELTAEEAAIAYQEQVKGVLPQNEAQATIYDGLQKFMDGLATSEEDMNEVEDDSMSIQEDINDEVSQVEDEANSMYQGY